MKRDDDNDIMTLTIIVILVRDSTLKRRGRSIISLFIVENQNWVCCDVLACVTVIVERNLAGNKIYDDALSRANKNRINQNDGI